MTRSAQHSVRGFCAARAALGSVGGLRYPAPPWTWRLGCEVISV